MRLTPCSVLMNKQQPPDSFRRVLIGPRRSFGGTRREKNWTSARSSRLFLLYSSPLLCCKLLAHLFLSAHAGLSIPPPKYKALFHHVDVPSWITGEITAISIPPGDGAHISPCRMLTAAFFFIYFTGVHFFLPLPPPTCI